MPIGAATALGYFRQAGYRLLDVVPAHVMALESLPRHHGDPFDRILIAQALVEPLRLVTHDPMVARYGDTVIEV